MGFDNEVIQCASRRVSGAYSNIIVGSLPFWIH